MGSDICCILRNFNVFYVFGIDIVICFCVIIVIWVIVGDVIYCYVNLLFI